MFGLSAKEKEAKLRNDLEDYISAKLQQEPDYYYNFEVINEVNKMPTETLQKFCNFIAQNEVDYNARYTTRSLGAIGQLFNAGFQRENLDPRQYNPTKQFYDIVRSKVNDLQNLQYGQVPYFNDQQIFDAIRENCCERINNVVKKYGLTQDRSFFDFASRTEGNMPTQGWKLHLAADSIQKYCEMVEKIVPEFVANNVQFKLLNPDHFRYVNDGSNVFGKEFTIYPTKDFDLNNFSEDVIKLLSETPERAAATDQYFGNRITARFGGFTKSTITQPTGLEYRDERIANCYAPAWVGETSLKDILTFHSRIEDKYKQTGDIHLYLQEYMLGIECNGALDTYVFNEYIFDNPDDALSLQQQTLRCGGILHLDDHYIVVAPEAQQQRLDAYCQANNLSYRVFSGENRTLGLNNALQQYQNMQQDNQSMQQNYYQQQNNQPYR